jgi:hypothetical protein
LEHRGGSFPDHFILCGSAFRQAEIEVLKIERHTDHFRHQQAQ